MRRIVLAALVSVAGVAAASGLAFALKPFAPALSLGVLYVPAVMAAAAYGMSYSVGVAVASMLTFNFLFLPPVHSFTLRDSENWIALAVYLGVAIVVSQLAARTRRQAQESALLAEIATSLLRRGGVSGQLERIANETAAALHVDRAHIDLDDSTRGDGEHYPLAVEGRRLGTITLEHPRQGGAAARKRLLPALASLLGVAIDRERLAREAL
ncbi:MAG: DUF4118 domain-containing protein, partial [Gaiellaceae bacterium]